MTPNVGLTVVIPAYNASDTIAHSVESAIAVAEAVIVVDDGSSDDTATRAAGLGVQVVKQLNMGASHARRVGAVEVKTDYLCFLDSDDTLVAAGVEESLRIMRESADVGVCAGAVLAQKQNIESISSAIPRAFSDVTTATLVTNGYSPWPPAAALIRTADYEKQASLGLPQLHTRFAEDYELLLRLSMVTTIVTHETPACVYRVDGGKSAVSTTKVVESKERIRSYYGAFNSLNWTPLTSRQRAAAVEARTAHAAHRAGDLKGAAVHSVRATLYDPRLLMNAVGRRLKNSLP